MHFGRKILRALCAASKVLYQKVIKIVTELPEIPNDLPGESDFAFVILGKVTSLQTHKEKQLINYENLYSKGLIEFSGLRC